MMFWWVQLITIPIDEFLWTRGQTKLLAWPSYKDLLDLGSSTTSQERGQVTVTEIVQIFSLEFCIESQGGELLPLRNFIEK